MAAQRSVDDLLQEYRAHLQAYENAEPGSPESNYHQGRARQMLPEIHDRIADDMFPYIYAELIEVEREKRIEKERLKKKKDRCSIMATGGNVYKPHHRIGRMK
jgi:hypothetical protein